VYLSSVCTVSAASLQQQGCVQLQQRLSQLMSLLLCSCNQLLDEASQVRHAGWCSLQQQEFRVESKTIMITKTP